MRLNTLTLSNFRQHAESRIDFDLGLTGIIGPNGAGKSTVLEAIAWALYGQPAARGNKDSIRFARATARASVRVELDFEMGSHRYRVVRGLNSAELYLDGGENPIANSLTAVTDALQRRLGMSREEFFHTYFTGQKELNVMSNMGPSERAQFLSRVLGYEKLRVAQEMVKDKKREVAAQLQGIRGAMQDAEFVKQQLAEATARQHESVRARSSAETAHGVVHARLTSLTPAWTRAQQGRERFAQLTSELRLVDSERAARLRDRERLARDLTETETARSELTRLSEQLAPYAALGDEYEMLERLRADHERRVSRAEAIRTLAEEIAEKRERRTRIEGAAQAEETVVVTLEAKRREADGTLARLNQVRTEWTRDKQEAETRRDALRAAYTELKEQRDKVLELGEDGACPTCTRVLGSNFRSVLDQLDEQLEEVTVDGRYFSNRVTQLEAEPPELARLEEQRLELQREATDLEGQLGRVRGEVLELANLDRDLAVKGQRYDQWQKELAAIPTGYDKDRDAAVRAELERLVPLNEQAMRLSTLLEREPKLLEEKEQVDAAMKALEDRLVTLSAASSALAFSEDAFQKLRVEFERAEDEARVAEVTLERAREQERGAQRALEAAMSAASQLAKTQQLEQQLVGERRIHEELDRAFVDFRTSLNHDLRPELSELASAFLAELTDHRYSELVLDDDYNLVVYDEGRPKPVISGGEEDLANLSLRLAISQMIAERAGQSFSLLVLDEVLGSLDEVRRHNVVELLRRLQDRFEQVILITHIESVRQGFDRVIGISYDEESGSAVVRPASSAGWDPESLEGTLLAGIDA